MENIFDWLKKQKDSDQKNKDQTFVLMKTVIDKYKSVDINLIDVIDLEVIYFVSVGTFKHSFEEKTKLVEKSALSKCDKQEVISLMEKINQSLAKEKTHIGYFGAASHRMNHSTKKEAKRFIKLCVEISEYLDDEERVINRVEEEFKEPIKGVQSAVASQVLYFIAPDIFPILNSRGRTVYENCLDIELEDAGSLLTYTENLKKIRNYRNGTFSFKDYLIIDHCVLNCFREFVNEYLEYLDKNTPKRKIEELYKFELVEYAQENINQLLSPQNNYPFWKEIGSKQSNLASDGFDYSFNSFLKLLKEDSKEALDFITLCKKDRESNDGVEWEEFYELGEKLKEKVGNKRAEFNTRFITFILSVISPSEYYFLYPAKWKQLIKNIFGFKIKDKNGNKIEETQIIYEYANEIYFALQEMPRSEEIFNKFLNPEIKYYEKNHLTWFVQDFMWWFVDHKIKNYEENENEQEKVVKNDRDGAEKCNYKLNTIFYGPPGTGKTYIAIERAVEIIEGKKPVDRKYAKMKFDEYRKQNRIGFVSFHQSFSYEDFVHGIRPSTSGDEIRYELREGIFKRMCESAGTKSVLLDVKDLIDIEKTKIFKMSLGNTQYAEDKDIYKYCIDENVVVLGYGGTVDYSGCKTADDIRSRCPNKDSFDADAIERFILWMEKGHYVFISNGNRLLKAIGRIDSDYIYNDKSESRYPHERKVKWLAKDLNIPIKDLYSRFFSQQCIYEMYNNNFNKEALQRLFSKGKTSDNYVLIIDEISRANVAGVFGELITLIEGDKRVGNKNETFVTLPYSDESEKDFGVPNNLYLLGTMNTADKSVESLDLALRRRFSFEEFSPDVKHIDCPWETEMMKKILNSLNERIEVLLDRDHLVGHSYFMGKEISSFDGLKSVFSSQIIPLLREYFYNDFEKLSWVLGDGFVEIISGEKVKFAKGYGDGVDEYEAKPRYRLVPSEKWTLETFKKIYE